MKGKIFTAPEVQAILDGSKVMFREVIKPTPWDVVADGDHIKGNNIPRHGHSEKRIECPYQFGQKIFCKESFLQKICATQLPSGEHETFFYGSEVEYIADGAQERWDNPNVYYPNWWKKRAAQHMKQEHSRLTLRITGTRVEKLADISEEDAFKEGLDLDSAHSQLCLNIQDQPYSNDLINGSALKTIFARNWNATRKKPEEKFEANPWVWCVEFKIINNKGE